MLNLKDTLGQTLLFAFNIDDFVVFKAVAETLRELNKPAILHVSEGQADFWGMERFAALVKLEKERGLPVFLGLDHGKSLESVERAISLGFDIVHFDGSSLSLEENINLSRQAVQKAHDKGILIELEPQEQNTSPEIAARFNQETGADLLAVFVGNRHGFDPETAEKLDLNVLSQIKEAVGDTLLTLHGGSGVPDNDLTEVIKRKLIAKVNINSEMRQVYKKTLLGTLPCFTGDQMYKLFESMQAVLGQVVRRFIETIEEDSGLPEY